MIYPRPSSPPTCSSVHTMLWSSVHSFPASTLEHDVASHKQFPNSLLRLTHLICSTSQQARSVASAAISTSVLNTQRGHETSSRDFSAIASARVSAHTESEGTQLGLRMYCNGLGSIHLDAGNRVSWHTDRPLGVCT